MWCWCTWIAGLPNEPVGEPGEKFEEVVGVEQYRQNEDDSQEREHN